jgi:hypothetical protein
MGELDPHYSKIYYCHTDRKYLDDETSMRAHVAMGHSAAAYISIPKNVPKYEKKEHEKRQ